MKRLEPELTKIQAQKVVSPASEFLKIANIPEVFKNILTLEFNAENIPCPSNCDAVAGYADGTQAGLNKLLDSVFSIILKTVFNLDHRSWN